MSHDDAITADRIAAALEEAGGGVIECARALGVSRRTLHRRLNDRELAAAIAHRLKIRAARGIPLANDAATLPALAVLAARSRQRGTATDPSPEATPGRAPAVEPPRAAAAVASNTQAHPTTPRDMILAKLGAPKR